MHAKYNYAFKTRSILIQQANLRIRLQAYMHFNVLILGTNNFHFIPFISPIRKYDCVFYRYYLFYIISIICDKHRSHMLVTCCQ